MSILELRDDRLAGIVDASEVREVAGGFQFTEGAVWDDEQGRLIFSDIAGDAMFQLAGDEQLPPGRQQRLGGDLPCREVHVL